MNDNKCIFRKSSSCIRCKNDIANIDSNYCLIHKNDSNIIYNIINNFIGNKKKIETRDIYNLLCYINDNKDISIENKETIFKIILNNFFNVKILRILYSTIFNNKEIKKKVIINALYSLYNNTYNIIKDENKLRKIIYLQKNILKFLIKKLNIINHNDKNKIPENTEDPFTYDLINEIPEKNKFYYIDSKEHLYIYDAVELDYFIKKNGAWNPYTRDIIDDIVVYKLNKFINYNRLNRKSLDTKYEWKTPLQAYTDVSQSIEQVGFYNDVEWFMKLSYSDIKQIIRKFHNITNEIPNNNLYFNININNQTYIYDFAKQIIKLFENGNEHYILCCKFIKALSFHSLDFYNNLPEWLVDIDVTTTTVNARNARNPIDFNDIRLYNNIDIINGLNVLFYMIDVD